MLISVFSPKGGTGSTVTSVLCGLGLARYGPTLTVDGCGGDLIAVAGVDPPQYCFSDWLHSPEPTPESLSAIGVEIKDDFHLVAGVSASANDQISELMAHDVHFEKRQRIVEALVQSGNCVVDLGTNTNSLSCDIAQASDLVIMVTRQCYLALERATRHPLISHVDACVVMCESGRSISENQIAKTLSLSTMIHLDARRDYARCIDAGVLVHRTPSRLIAPLAGYLADMMDAASATDSPERDVHFNQIFWAENDARQKILKPQYAQHVTSMLRGKP